MAAGQAGGEGGDRGASGFVALPEGTRLDGRYIIKSVLGAGGFGITYIAEHEALRTTVAVKENFPRQCAYRQWQTTQIHPTDTATFRWAHERFLDEGRRLAKCRHPNIVGVTNVFEENGTAYIVLEYEEGQTLLAWLRALGRPPTQAEIDALLLPVLDALEYVHAQGLLHRDIAPDNIMIRRDGKPCLIDFGAAREAIAERSQAMSAVVKPGYSPIEQFSRDGRAQGPWSDIYALAATFSTVVLGSAPPEAADRAIEDRLRPLREVLPSPERYRASFLDGLDHALRLKQSERPQSVGDWRKLLFAEVTTQQPADTATAKLRPPNVATVETPQRPRYQPATSARSRLPWVAGILLAMILAGGAAVIGRRPVAEPTAVLAIPAGEVRAPAVAPLAPKPQSPATTPAAKPAAVEPAAPAALPRDDAKTAPLGAAVAPSPPSTLPTVNTAPSPAASPGAATARRIEVGSCFNEFRSKARARLAAADQDACAALCDARASDCEAWEFLVSSVQQTNCALFSPAPATTLPCSAARAGANGAIGYRQ